ncbi:MAG: hypothetical protein KAW93_02685, partial [Methanogenium sp.]|nr:hypothetical protein [Methanogenium sp.]
ISTGWTGSNHLPINYLPINHLPINLINHYIWSIKDAGVSTSNNDLERAAIEYIQCLKNFGENIFEINERYCKECKRKLAKSMTHICSSIREIGQKLAEKRLERGTIESIVAIKYLAKLTLDKNSEMWYTEDHVQEKQNKLSFVRIIWNLKDVGRSAAENGIEKAIVRVIEGLFDLLKSSIPSDEDKWIENKKSKALIRLGEGFYEISMKTKNQGLQEAFSKIIYYNVLCIYLIHEGTKIHYIKNCVLNIYLKNFVDFKLVENFSEDSIKSVLQSDKYKLKTQSFDNYPGLIEEVPAIISNYYNSKQ